jgi:hypothetical protein
LLDSVPLCPTEVNLHTTAWGNGFGTRFAQDCCAATAGSPRSSFFAVQLRRTGTRAVAARCLKSLAPAAYNPGSIQASRKAA